MPEQLQLKVGTARDRVIDAMRARAKRESRDCLGRRPRCIAEGYWEDLRASIEVHILSALMLGLRVGLHEDAVDGVHLEDD